MPHKDRDERLAYQREWYFRPENRKRVIANVKRRKWTTYAGQCQYCGAKTSSSTKSRPSKVCNRSECRSKFMRDNRENLAEWGRKMRAKQLWDNRTILLGPRIGADECVS